MVKTKSIYDARTEDDGVRVLVTRYWPRGVRKGQADMWLKGLGPSAELIRDWKAGEIPWAEFKRRYSSEFASKEKKELLEELKRVVRDAKGPVTLLCTCRTEECHRNLLKARL